MVDQFLRRPKERLLAPLARRLGARVRPTTLTLIAFGCGVAAAAALWRGATAAGLSLWALNRIIDGLDGSVARATATQSDWGGYLDILLDVVVYALVPLGLALRQGTPAALLALAALLASFYANAISWSYLAAVLEKRSAGAKISGELTSVTMPAGLIEGAETVLFFCAFIVFSSHLVWLFGLMAALVGLTVAQRLVWAYRILGPGSAGE
ncbi:MAG TPA: CDP-alcohol phosphatidyltransferase family protein [Herpetosiphonaceae bacterium]|nr:CDP-alcohol phosphatidyltransferase family protein [Herpetosiphonaceae bacterium]